MVGVCPALREPSLPRCPIISPNNDPNPIFAFVRDKIGYESYKGSLRGARGTLWSKAGNALDQASLLIALLRVSGIEAQYVQGTLSDELSKDLILSMFPNQVWDNMEKAGIPFTMHWGKFNSHLTPDRIKKMYGANAQEWIDSRKELLKNPKVRQVFTNDFLKRVGLAT